ASALHRAGLIDHLQRETRSLAAKADALTAAFDTTLEGWSRALELRDSSAEGHTQRVSEMSQRLGKAAGMSQTELEHLRRGALLHDIGKTSVSDAILKKPGPLNAEEWAAIRRHPQLAHDLLAPVPLLNSALAVPTGHHERWDGSGYPRGLVGEQIPLAARVFALADVWDALTHGRPYRRAWSPEKALEYIRGEAGRHFDPRLVELFLMLVEEGAGEPEALDLSVTA
ncbi:MAG TPA: HD-GYP domain-containing protein, partial [Anaerolineaceae bacterium]